MSDVLVRSFPQQKRFFVLEGTEAGSFWDGASLFPSPSPFSLTLHAETFAKVSWLLSVKTRGCWCLSFCCEVRDKVGCALTKEMWILWRITVAGNTLPSKSTPLEYFKRKILFIKQPSNNSWKKSNSLNTWKDVLFLRVKTKTSVGENKKN